MTLSRGERGRAAFVDTSAFYGLLDTTDQWHELAREGFAFLARRGGLLFTSDLVVAETYRLALHRCGRDVALDWLAALGDVNVLYHLPRMHEETVTLLTSSRRPLLTYTDAASIAAARGLGIGQVFTFDRGFAAHGLTLFPPNG